MNCSIATARSPEATRSRASSRSWRKAPRVEALEQHVVHAALERREALEQLAALGVGSQQHAAAIGRVSDLLEDAARHQLVRSMVMKAPERCRRAATSPTDSSPAGARDEHQDLVLRPGDADDRGEGVAAAVQAVAVGDEIVDQPAELGIRAFDQQRRARDRGGRRRVEDRSGFAAAGPGH